jgi:hypothetical protein
VTLPTAYLSDRYKSRVLPTVVTGLLAVIGFSLYLGNALFLTSEPHLTRAFTGAKSKHVLYGSLFLSVPGVYAPVPIFM